MSSVAQAGEMETLQQALALAQVGKVGVSSQVAQQGLSAAQDISDEQYTVPAPSGLPQVSRSGQALSVTMAAFQVVELLEHDAEFAVLRDTAPALAGIDRGKTLSALYEAVMEVETWWDAPWDAESLSGGNHQSDGTGL